MISHSRKALPIMFKSQSRPRQAAQAIRYTVFVLAVYLFHSPLSHARTDVSFWYPNASDANQAFLRGDGLLGETTFGSGCCDNWEIPQCETPTTTSRNARGWWKGGNWGSTFYVYCAYNNAACPAGQTRYAPFGQCEITHNEKKNKGKPLCGQAAGNPINTANGTKFQEEVDFPETGASPLNFVRYYTSNFNFEVTTMGPNWRHNYLRTVIVNSAIQVTVIRQDGKEYVFNWIGDTWTPEADISEQLIALLDSTGTRTGWQLTTYDRSIETYDNAGKLMAVKNPIGRTLTLTYSDNSTPATIAPGPGFLIKISDDFNRSLNLTYATVWRYYFVNTLTDPAGNVYRYSYESTNRNLKTVTYPDNTPGKLTDNAKRTYLYGSETGEAAYALSPVRAHTLTGILDENGNRYATYRYDANGKAISTEHAGGVFKYRLAYNADGSKTDVTDPLGTVRTTHFASLLGVVKSTGSDQPGGSGCGASASQISYDANGNIASDTDFNGNVSCYAYDLSRNLETVRIEGLTPGSSCPANLAIYTPPAGSSERKIVKQWHANYRLPEQIDEADRRTVLSYDTYGNLLAKTITDTATQQSRTWTYTYNALGQILTADGPRSDVNDVTTYTYYNDTTATHHPGDLHTVSNALGHTTTFTNYDANGHLLSLADPNGLIIGFAYDPRGRLTHKTVDGHTTIYDYDNVGSLIQVTRPTGVFYRFTYDAAHRLTDITDALSGKIHYTLDAMGNRIREDIKDAEGHVVKTHSRVYDALNRLAQDIGAYNQTRDYQYDANGNLIQITDAAGHATQQQYDSLDRLIRTTDALNGQTDYDYDALDRLTQVTDANNHSTVYSYNGLGDLLQLDSPNTGTTQYGYDSAGNLAQKIDAGNITATYQYDAMNRLLGVDYPGTDADIVNTYDGYPNNKGRLTHAKRGNEGSYYYFDRRGNLISTSARGLPHPDYDNTIGYSYNADDQLTGIYFAFYRDVQYRYDAAGQVSKIWVHDIDDGDFSGVGYNVTRTLADQIKHLPFGPVKSLTYGNGLALNRQYDADYRLTGQQVGILQNLTYAYDASGNLQAATDLANAGNNQSYGYDPVNRLLMASGTNNLAYSYDAVGNRLLETRNAVDTQYRYDLDNQHLLALTGSRSDSLLIDERGSITQTGGKTLVYAPDQRLSQVKQGGSEIARYRYDAFGQRTGKTTSSGSVYYDYDPSGQLLNESNTPANYVYLDGELLARVDYWPDDRSGSVQYWPIHYFHNNPVGAPLKTSSNYRNVTWSAKLDAFGKATSINPNITQNLRFPGQYYDQETGWHYNMQRYYDPGTGRYLQSDPIGLVGGTNTYTYVRNNPLSWIDPSGLDSVLIFQTEPDWQKSQSPAACNNAASYAGGQALNSCANCSPNDIHVIPVNDVGQVNSALSNFSDIAQIYFIGHSSSSSIYVGSQNLPNTNISNNGGANDVLPSKLNWSNLKSDASINILGCNAGKGNNSIAQQISNASGRATTAPNQFLNFDEAGKPFFRPWRSGSFNTFFPNQ